MKKNMRTLILAACFAASFLININFIYAGEISNNVPLVKTINQFNGSVNPAPVAPNILLIIVDDLSRDTIADTTTSSFLNRLKADGITFEKAHANPICSATRVELTSGLKPRNTTRDGVSSTCHMCGYIVKPGQAGDIYPALSLDVSTVAEMLKTHAQWETFKSGKSHTQDNLTFLPAALRDYDRSNLVNGNLQGLNMDGSNQDHNHFPVVVNGGLRLTDVQQFSATYQINRAIDMFRDLTSNNNQQPVFGELSLSVAHDPLTIPPYHLLKPETIANMEQVTFPINTLWEQKVVYKAMLEATGVELDRLLNAVDSNTLIFFMADNGLGMDDFNKSKGSPYNGGTNIPLIVSGPVQNPGSTESALFVNPEDIARTILDIAGISEENLQHLKGKSFKNILGGESVNASNRKISLTEIFVSTPEGTGNLPVISQPLGPLFTNTNLPANAPVIFSVQGQGTEYGNVWQATGRGPANATCNIYLGDSLTFAPNNVINGYRAIPVNTSSNGTFTATIDTKELINRLKGMSPNPVTRYIQLACPGPSGSQVVSKVIKTKLPRYDVVSVRGYDDDGKEYLFFKSGVAIYQGKVLGKEVLSMASRENLNLIENGIPAHLEVIYQRLKKVADDHYLGNVSQ